MATLNPHRLSTATATVAPGLTIAEAYDGQGLTTLRVRGEIDAATTCLLRAALRRHDAPGTSLLLDLTGVRAIDAQGVSVILAFAATVRGAGGRVAVIAPDAVLQSLAALPHDTSFAVSITLH